MTSANFIKLFFTIESLTELKTNPPSMIERDGASNVDYQFNESTSQRPISTKKANLSLNVRKFETSGQQNLTVDQNPCSSASINRNSGLKKSFNKLRKEHKEVFNSIGNQMDSQQTGTSRNKKLDRLNYTNGIDILQAYKLKYKAKDAKQIEIKINTTSPELSEQTLSKSILKEKHLF